MVFFLACISQKAFQSFDFLGEFGEPANNTIDLDNIPSNNVGDKSKTRDVPLQPNSSPPQLPKTAPPSVIYDTPSKPRPVHKKVLSTTE